jgi:hypothetical protein
VLFCSFAEFCGAMDNYGIEEICLLIIFFVFLVALLETFAG